MSDDDDDEEPYKVGRGKPPEHTKFKPGKTGNRNGRPKGSRSKVPYDGVLGRMIPVSEGGKERNLEAAEAFLLFLQKRWTQGDSTARRLMRRAFDARSELRATPDETEVNTFVVSPIAAGSPNGAFLALKMGVKHDAFRPTARILIEPWLVQASLDRLGERRLTREEQQVVLKATRTPSKVIWPSWWEVLL
jgi:Family of unknown function (DUF5681)